MANVWESMGQGVQAGINAYLERMRQQKEGTQNQALIDLRQKELGLNQANAVREQDLIADAQARAEQEKRVGGYKKPSDLSDPSKGIFVYEYEELSPGAYVPVPRDKQMLEYQRQFEQYEAREKRLADEERDREIAVVKARPGAEKPPEEDLVGRLYDKTAKGNLNTAILTTVVTRALVPNGSFYDALTLLKGPEGAQRARELARGLGQWASSAWPGRDTEKDILTFLAAWSPELAKELFPQPAPGPSAAARAAAKAEEGQKQEDLRPKMQALVTELKALAKASGKPVPQIVLRIENSFTTPYQWDSRQLTDTLAQLEAAKAQLLQPAAANPPIYPGVEGLPGLPGAAPGAGYVGGLDLSKPWLYQK